MAEKIFMLAACHMMGDYVLQTRFVAESKGQNWYHLFVHCILYAVPFYLVFGWCWQLALIAALHGPIDALKARYYKIGYVQDQILHYVLLASYLF